MEDLDEIIEAVKNSIQTIRADIDELRRTEGINVEKKAKEIEQDIGIIKNQNVVFKKNLRNLSGKTDQAGLKIMKEDTLEEYKAYSKDWFREFELLERELKEAKTKQTSRAE